MDDRHRDQLALPLGFGLDWTPVRDEDGTELVVPNDVSRAQRLMFELMQWRANEYDGTRIVRDLITHRPLWRGVVLTRSYKPLITLRDIDHSWNADTLYIQSNERDDVTLIRLIESWSPDDYGQVMGDEYEQLVGLGSPHMRIYWAWWD